MSEPAAMTDNSKAYDTFTWLRSETIDSLNVIVSEYQHKITGARHYHIASDNEENVFLVGFRTVPEDSTGVAHILEHTSLCGSEKYPVRDPFFMMIRRSLNTFMNAFTSSDWTAYPFATKNRKDFNNLLNVYLDAVFFSRLDSLDFAQEGHRLEFEEPANPETDLVYRGVVYNEMKGAMSSPVSILYDALSRYLFPTVTYHFNSGGDPEQIPGLSYEELKAFYATHYHPGNAVFMTYGNISAREHQKNFEERALSRFTPSDTFIHVHDEKRYFSPVKIEEAYPMELAPEESESDAIASRTHIVSGWLLNSSLDLESQLRAHLLTDILLDNSASPLRKMLETCGLGAAPSPLCGLEDSNKQMSFICGIEGSSPDKADELDRKITEVLEQVAADGVPLERLEATLHQLELHQREVGGDGYPYGLQLIMLALPCAMHRGDAIALLNLDTALDKLRQEIRDPAFIKNQVKQLLLDNPHRVRLVLRPDPRLAGRRDQQLKQHLSEIKANLTNGQKDDLVNQAQTLLERQQQQEDEDILPKVGKEDIPANSPMPDFEENRTAGSPLSIYPQGTNGLTYQQVVYSLPPLTTADFQLLPLYSNLIGELGAGDDNYLTIQDRITAVSGGIGNHAILRAHVDDEQKIRGYNIYSGKCLNRNNAPLAELLKQITIDTRFAEHARIRELIGQYRLRSQQGITSNGHQLAMLAASSGMNPTANISHRTSGLAGIKAIQQLDDRLNEEAALQELVEDLTELHQRLQSGERQFLTISDKETLSDLPSLLNSVWETSNENAASPLQLDPVREQVRQCWHTSTQVNFCARAYPTVPPNHPDAAPLSILGGFLRNGHLHRAFANKEVHTAAALPRTPTLQHSGSTHTVTQECRKPWQTSTTQSSGYWIPSTRNSPWKKQYWASSALWINRVHRQVKPARPSRTACSVGMMHFTRLSVNEC